MILHGHVRRTDDVDFFFARDRESLQRLFAALENFWGGDAPGGAPGAQRTNPVRVDVPAPDAVP